MESIKLSDSPLTIAFGDQPSTRKPRGYRRDIDGLRAVAVTSVVAYHAGLLFFSGGYVGVDVFFVISGYLIGAHVYRDVTHGRFSIAAFYQRRAKRILPALFMVLLFCYLAALLLLDAPELKTFAEYVVATVGSASNILIWLKVNYFAPGADQNPLLMTWSLGVEEQFYVFFPLIMMLLYKMGRKRLFTITLVVTALSLLLSVLGLLKYRNATFYLLPTRAWELSIGVLLAIYENNRPAKELYGAGRFANWLGLLGLGLLLYPIVKYNDSTMFPGMAATLPVLGSALILMSPEGWVNRYLLSSQPFVFLGLVSYSWYLWHWPLLSFARIASDHAITTRAASAIAVLSLVVAWCSYRFVEQPFRNSQTATGPLLLKYAVLCVLMVVPGLVLVALHGLPQRFPELATIEQRSGLKLNNDPCLVEYGVDAPNLSKYCVPTQDDRAGIALLGDSHASALGKALRELAENKNMKMYEMTKSSCPPLEGVTRRMLNHSEHDRECASFNDKAIEIVRKDPRITTVWLAGYWSAPFVEESSGARYVLKGERAVVSPDESSANLALGLNSVVAALRASGKRVVVVQDVPFFSFDPVRRVRSDFIPMRRWVARGLEWDRNSDSSVPRSEIVNPQDSRASSIVERTVESSAEIFDLKKNLCDSQFCYFYSDGLLLYVDPQHLSLAGSRRALQDAPLTSNPSISPSKSKRANATESGDFHICEL